MSMAIARSKYTGDPGFFDFLKKTVAIGTSFIPGVGGGISQAIMGLGKQPPRPVAGPGSVATIDMGMGRGIAGESRGRCLPGQTQGRDGKCRWAFEIDPGAIMLGGDPFIRGLQNGGARPAMAMPGNGAGMQAGGYHLNKSSYFLMSGEFVPAGSKWVRNRKRNPANARATSRAISRVTGAKRYAKSLSRISIRKKC